MLEEEAHGGRRRDERCVSSKDGAPAIERAGDGGNSGKHLGDMLRRGRMDRASFCKRKQRFQIDGLEGLMGRASDPQIAAEPDAPEAGAAISQRGFAIRLRSREVVGLLRRRGSSSVLPRLRES